VVANAAWFLAGLAALVVGAEVMVRGGARVAARFGISPIVVGLTVVSIGTSMPELAVGVVAALDDNGALAVGNITGTNVVNLLLVLGLSALLVPLSLQIRTLRFELPVMAGAAALLWLLAADGVLSRFDGLVMALGAVVYTIAVVRAARRENQDVTTEFTEAFSKARSERTGLHVGMTLIGIVIIVLGAERLVDAAVGMARGFGVSDALIGLTVVAVGTSAPELVTTVVSTVRGERDIAIGNLLGSSIYNILLILGVTCLVPAHGLTLPTEMVRIDIPIMVAVALVCVPIFVSGRRVSRFEGGALVCAYAAFLAFLLLTQTLRSDRLPHLRGEAVQVGFEELAHGDRLAADQRGQRGAVGGQRTPGRRDRMPDRGDVLCHRKIDYVLAARAGQLLEVVAPFLLRDRLEPNAGIGEFGEQLGDVGVAEQLRPLRVVDGFGEPLGMQQRRQPQLRGIAATDPGDLAGTERVANQSLLADRIAV
jgi:cation:H+ antiporter